MWKKLRALFVSPFAEASDLIYINFKFHKYIWSVFPWRIVKLVSFAVFGALFSYAGQATIGLLVNKLVSTTKTGTMTLSLIMPYFIALLAALILPRAISVIRNYMEMEDWRLFDLWCEQILNRKSAELDFSYHEDSTVVSLMRKVRDNIYRIKNFYSRPANIIEGFVWLIAALVTLFVINPWYSLILLVTTIPELVIETKFGSVYYKLWGQTMELRRKRSIVNDYFKSPETLTEIKLMGLKDYLLEKASKFFWDFMHLEVSAEQKRIRYSFLTTLFAQGGVVFAAYLMLNGVLSGSIQIGTFVMAFSLMLNFQGRLSGMFGYIARQSEDKNYVSDFFKIMELKNVLHVPDSPTVLGNATPTIVFENVGFTYPGSEIPVLTKVNLSICPGEKIAIVGLNGAGKTTLIKLLFRFYDPTEGRILIDGNDLKELSADDWYKHLGSLFQKYTNYSFPLREAIGVADILKSPDDVVIRSALEKSEAASFVSGYKFGFDTQLGRQFTDGVEPSVGQWQKLALARVFYRNANIYVLDEPTSAIDAEAEAHVFDNLAKLPSDKTVLFVSHRFSTIRQAHRICVIENGTINELGTHDELIKNDSTYKRLFELQAKGYQ